MSFYGDLKTNFIKAPTEMHLVEELRKLELAHDGMIKIINIYVRSGGVVAWYYHDIKRAGFPPKTAQETKKKPTKKKAKK